MFESPCRRFHSVEAGGPPEDGNHSVTPKVLDEIGSGEGEAGAAGAGDCSLEPRAWGGRLGA